MCLVCGLETCQGIFLIERLCVNVVIFQIESVTKHQYTSIYYIDNCYRLERLAQDTQSSGYSSDDHMNLKRPKRSQVLPHGQENDFRPYYQDRRHIAPDELRRIDGNKCGTEFVPFENLAGDRHNWKKAGRLIRDSLR